MSGANTSRMLSGVADISKLTSNKKKKLNKLFRDYNTDLTSYSEKVLKRKETQAKDLRLEDAEFYSTLKQHSKLLSQRNQNKSYQYYDNQRKNQYLDFIASRPEIKEVLTKMCNELVVTHEDSSMFAIPKVKDMALKELGFKENVIKEITDNVKLSYSDFYKKLNMSRDGSWNHMYEFLKKGKKAWEIIYDNPENPKRILHFIEIEPNSLEQMFDDDGQRMWIHSPQSLADMSNGSTWQQNGITNTHSGNNRKILYDHQIIYIDWNSDMANSEHTSYLEQLIKPYNMMRIIDETKIIWSVTNATFRTMYSIPTSNQGRNRAEQTVSNAMEMYKDHYSFDNFSGDISVNGEQNIPFAKDIFVGNGESGQPDISVIGGEGFDLSSIEPNEYFQKKFRLTTGIPISRFEASSSETWNLDPTSIYREEMDFDRYKLKIRETFSKVLIKPVLYQLVMDKPEFHDEPDIPENIYLEYTSYSIFSRLMELEMLKAQFESVEQIRSSAGQELSSGETLPFMPMTYILKKYCGYTEDEITEIENERMSELNRNLLIEKKVSETRKKYGINDEFGGDFDDIDGGGFPEQGAGQAPNFE